jgi:hypothetical protein
MTERRSKHGWLAPLLLVGLVALFLLPYVFLGRSMLPLELIRIFQPWASHPEAFTEPVPPVHNALLDTLQQYFPRRVYMTEALAGGWLPLWNPNVYGGTPFLATQQAAVLYPPAWLLALLPPALQFGWSAVMHLTAAALGGFLFFRRLGLNSTASATGAVGFAFNGFVVVWLAYPNFTQWTLCWLPLALYLWERGRTDGARWTAACAGVLSLILLGGHGQISGYTFLVWGLWAAYRTLAAPGAARTWLRLTGRHLLLPLALAVTLAAGHLLPAFDYAPRTNRGERIPWDRTVQAGMPAAQLWTMLLPRLFGDETSDFLERSWLPAGGKAGMAYIERTFYPGVSVLVLAVGGLVWLRRSGDGAASERRHLALFSAALTVLGVLWAMGTPLYWPLWRAAPGFGQFTAIGRMLGICAWSLAALAALGVHAMTESRDEVRSRALRWIGGASAVILLLTLIGHFIHAGADPLQIRPILAQLQRASLDDMAMRDLLLALAWASAPALLAFLAARKTGAPWRLSLAGGLAAAVVAADLFAFGFPFNPRSDPALLAVRTPELEALKHRPAGERFLSPRHPEPGRDLKERMPSNLPSVFGAADIYGTDSFIPLRYSDWEHASNQAAGGGTWQWRKTPNLRSAATRLYLTGARAPLEGLKPVVDRTLQEDLEALPYARLHLNAQQLTRPELLAALAHPQRATAIALTESPGGVVFNGPSRVEPFAYRRVNGNRMVLEGNASAPGLLVIAEGYDPGWRARVDGKPARLVPADHILTGVEVPQGAKRVELTYAPAAFRVGLFFTLAGLALLTGLLASRRRVRTDP